MLLYKSKHIDKIIRETGDVIDDGLHEIFVNTTVDDGTDIADLMACFTKKEVKNSKFPKLSGEVQRLKETEGGLSAVCELMEKYNQEAVDTEIKERIKIMFQKNFTVEQIVSVYPDISIDTIKAIETSVSTKL